MWYQMQRLAVEAGESPSEYIEKAVWLRDILENDDELIEDWYPGIPD